VPAIDISSGRTGKRRRRVYPFPAGATGVAPIKRIDHDGVPELAEPLQWRQVFPPAACYFGAGFGCSLGSGTCPGPDR
jgi:hypothetical protein